MGIRRSIAVAGALCVIGLIGCASPRASQTSTVASPATAGSATATPAAPASANGATPATSPAVLAPATRPQLDPKAYLALDQIEPVPVLSPIAPPTTATFGKPPLDALELYARARDALASNQRFTAVNLLEKAVRLDPDSAEPYRLLSRAYSASGSQTKAIDALLKATELAPNDLRTQVALGRLYLTRSDAPAAMKHLRLAMLTRDYQSDEAGAATADYFLARALQQQGYDRAAIDRYESLLRRIERRTLAIRGEPELNDWASRPEAIYADLARLYEKRGDWDKALGAWQTVVNRDSDDFDSQVHVVNMLVNLAMHDEALRAASDTVRRAGATPRSLELLRDVCRRLGNEEAAFDELRRLQAARPNDRSVLFALADLLATSNRDAEAQRLLDSAARQTWDIESLRKLYRFYSDRHRGPEAMTLLIEAAAARPALTSELLPMVAELLQPTRPDELRAAEIGKLAVPDSADAARQFFVASAAFAARRDTLGREALDRAIQHDPPFAPAFRLALIRAATRAEVDVEQRARDAAALVEAARSRGDAALAEELSAMALSRQNNQEPAAASAFERAIKAHHPHPPPDLLMNYADFLFASGNTARMEQTLWRTISDYPTFQGAYERLIGFHTQKQSPVAAINVLQKWLANDSTNADARLAEAAFLVSSGQVNDALRSAGDIVRQNAENAAVIEQAARVYRQAGRTPQFVQLLEDLRARQPRNVAVVDQLVLLYVQQQRTSDAAGLVDAARAACADQPRALYYIAQLYNRVQLKEQSLATLEEVLKLAPDDPGANNDLGYVWADDGMNLERAETMIRRAVEIEPDNTSFLDSLGWVLYKRGRFDEARQYLQQAADGADGPDAAVVLDHLGDTLYRLRDRNGAVSHWKRSLDELGLIGDRRDGDPLAELRRTLTVKLRAAEQGQAVDVAPAPGRGGSDDGPSTVPAAGTPARAQR